jgi:hypothetical protein
LSKNFKQLNVRAMQVLREEYTRQQMQRPWERSLIGLLKYSKKASTDTVTKG